jgi:hypothetical protein
VRPSAASTCLPLTKLEKGFMNELYHATRRSDIDAPITLMP